MLNNSFLTQSLDFSTVLVAFCCISVYCKFKPCTSLTSIEIPNSVTSIGDWAFSNCSSLTSINVSEDNASYQSIDGVLFSKNADTLIVYPCGKQELSYQIPNSVTNIGDVAFARCTSLTSIEIPNSVFNIGDGVFYDCSSLKQINVAKGNPNYVAKEGVLLDKSCRKLIAYPASKESKSYVIPKEVRTIEAGAFKGCEHLVSVTLPKNMELDFPFDGCTNLREIHLRNKHPKEDIEKQWWWDFNDCTLYIPKGSEEAYSRYNLEEIFKEVKTE